MKKVTAEKISKVLRQSEARLLKKSNVVGVGIGEKIKDGRCTGRTTDHTLGEIKDISATVRVDYDGRTALFRNQILTGAMSQGGDSGSLVLDRKRRAVGLLFAGSDRVTLCNPIRDVFKLLKVGRI